MNRIALYVTGCLFMVSLMPQTVHALDKTFTLPVDVASGGMVIDTDKDGMFDTVLSGKDNAMEWRLGRYFSGPCVIVMEIQLPKELQGKTVKVLTATLGLSANGRTGVFPENQPELAPDCDLWAYTGKQADGTVALSDVHNKKGKPTGTEAGLFIESQTPLKAGTVVRCDVADPLQKALDEKVSWIGFRIQAPQLPDQNAYWRWRGPVFAQKYGKQYAPVLKLKVSVD